MSRWEYFLIVWPAFWCGVIAGVGSMLWFYATRPYSGWVLVWTVSSVIVMCAPDAIATAIAMARRHRSQAPRP
jgi:hypothetical protein